MQAARLIKTGLHLPLLVSVCLFAVPATAAPEFKRGEKASVLIFTTTDCPVANAMMPEITRLQKEYAAKGIAFTLVHVDPDTTDALARKHAKDYGVSVPFALDPKHELVKRYKAARTPEAFLILPDGSIPYHGRINDLYYAPGQRRRSPTTHDLRDAMESILSSRPVAKSAQPAVGCVIADFAR